MLTISALTHDCRHSAYAIMQQTQPDTWSIDTFAQSLQPPNIAMQIMLANQCIGFYIIQALRTATFTEWTLEEIAVSPHYQGQGYGRTLLNELIKQARAAQVDDIFLEVRASNHRARKLYLSSGFVQIDVRKNYYPLAPQHIAHADHTSDSQASKPTHEDAIIMSWQR